MKRDNSNTRRLLVEAGIAPGMRVLELGCGGGEVTELLAGLVGTSGRVLALDRMPAALASAAGRMRELGVAHVEFLQLDVAEGLAALSAHAEGSFDALVGRRVLMYLPDPAAVLRGLSHWLRRGARVVFEESDATMVPARSVAWPAHDEALSLLRSTLVAEGVDLAMGFHLPGVLASAGFAFERVRAEAVIQGQPGQFRLPVLIQLMRQRLIDTGSASADRVDDLVRRLEAEAAVATDVYVSDMSFCAWGARR